MKTYIREYARSYSFSNDKYIIDCILQDLKNINLDSYITIESKYDLCEIEYVLDKIYQDYHKSNVWDELQENISLCYGLITLLKKKEEKQ